MGTNESNVVSLTKEKAKKFFEALRDDSFVVVVVADDGEVRVFSKDIEPGHLDRIKQYLSDLEEGE